MPTIAEKLERLRAGQSYSSIARSVGCSTNALRDLEGGRTGRPSVHLLARLARHFGVSLDWLADDSADWPPPKSDRERATELVREALARGGLTGDLTELERNLLAATRSLPRRVQQQLLAYVTGLATAWAVKDKQGAGEAAELEARLRKALAPPDGDPARPKGPGAPPDAK